MAQVLRFLRRRALWVYGVGMGLALIWFIGVMAFWPKEGASEDVFFGFVTLSYRLPLVWMIVLPIMAGIWLYGQHRGNGLMGIMLAAGTILVLILVVTIAGARLTYLDFQYATDTFANDRTYILTAHQPVTSRCDDDVCYEIHALYECDRFGLVCDRVRGGLRGGAGFMRMDAEDGTVFVFDSFEGMVIYDYTPGA